MPAASWQAKYSRRLYRLGCEKTALSKRKCENHLRLARPRGRKPHQGNLYYQWQEGPYKITRRVNEKWEIRNKKHENNNLPDNGHMLTLHWGNRRQRQNSRRQVLRRLPRQPSRHKQPCKRDEIRRCDCTPQGYKLQRQTHIMPRPVVPRNRATD